MFSMIMRYGCVAQLQMETACALTCDAKRCISTLREVSFDCCSIACAQTMQVSERISVTS
jgi:hypothetical protein